MINALKTMGKAGVRPMIENQLRERPWTVPQVRAIAQSMPGTPGHSIPANAAARLTPRGEVARPDCMPLPQRPVALSGSARVEN